MTSVFGLMKLQISVDIKQLPIHQNCFLDIKKILPDYADFFGDKMFWTIVNKHSTDIHFRITMNLKYMNLDKSKSATSWILGSYQLNNFQ